MTKRTRGRRKRTIPATEVARLSRHAIVWVPGLRACLTLRSANHKATGIVGYSYVYVGLWTPKQAMNHRSKPRTSRVFNKNKLGSKLIRVEFLHYTTFQYLNEWLSFKCSSIPKTTKAAHLGDSAAGTAVIILRGETSPWGGLRTASWRSCLMLMSPRLVFTPTELRMISYSFLANLELDV